jgi:hypothetical protein
MEKLYSIGGYKAVHQTEHISQATILKDQFTEFPEIHSTGNEQTAAV